MYTPHIHNCIRMQFSMWALVWLRCRQVRGHEVGIQHLNHIKVVREVHVVCMYDHTILILGVAAIAEILHLMISMDWKLSQEGPEQQHSQSIVDCMATPWKPIINSTQLRTSTSRPFCHTRAHLISCVGGVIPPHHNHICFKPLSHSIWPLSIQCLINWYCLTFDLPTQTHPHHLMAARMGHLFGTENS